MHHRSWKDKGHTGNSDIDQVLCVDLIIYFTIISTTIFQMFTDVLKFNLTEFVQPLFLTSTDIKSKTAKIEVFQKCIFSHTYYL